MFVRLIGGLARSSQRHAIYAAAAAELPDFPMGTGASVASVHGTNANGERLLG